MGHRLVITASAFVTASAPKRTAVN